MRLKDLHIPLCDIKNNKVYDEISPIKTSAVSRFHTTMLPSEINESQMGKRLRKKVKSENGWSSEESKSGEENDHEKEEESKSVRRRIVKVIGVKQAEESRKSTRRIIKVIDVKQEENSENDLSSEENESREENGYENGKVKSKNNWSSEEDESWEENGHGNEKVGELSEYEKMVENNRAERMAFIRSLKLEEAKAGFAELVDKVKKKPQPVKRAFKFVEKQSPPVIRKSRRLANLSVNMSEDALFEKAIKEAREEEKLKEKLPPELPFKQALRSEELYESYVKDVCIQEPIAESKFVSYDKSVIQKLTLDASNIAKVTPDRCTALAWYPSAENLIIASGTKYGNLGIWNVESESNPYVLRTHLEGTTNLQFNPLKPVHLVSSSYDGTLRCGDMVKHIFSEVYNVSDETYCTWFDFLSEATYLVAQKNGQVALVDDRTEKKRCEKRHTCHDYAIKTVNVHPVNKNVFVTAENKGIIRLWDLRKLQKQPVADITHHKRCAKSAFFSPITGNSILATSADDTISIFDSTNLTQDIKLKQLMKHNNQTGRWLSVFRATWLPNSDESFVIGSMQEPRRIQVFDKNMNVVRIIMSDNLTTITSTNAFHPCRPALAGANSSGKVVVFT